MKCFNIEKLNHAIELVECLERDYMLLDPFLNPYNEEEQGYLTENDEFDHFLCLQFIEEVLNEVKSDVEIILEKRKKIHEPFPYDVLINYEASAEPRTVTQTLKAFATLTEQADRKMIGAVKVNKWLHTHGYIDRVYIDEIENEDWYPTEKGNQVGITAALAYARGQSFMRITYDQNGQRFLAEHLEEIENEMLFSSM